MTETEYNDELYHYGVLGMKWGVHRAAAKARSEPKLKKRALKYEYKAAKKQIDANRISKITGYGLRAMKYSVKSDKVAKKAAKTRLKLANNQRYINMTKRRISDMQSDPKYQATIAELRKKYGSVIG